VSTILGEHLHGSLTQQFYLRLSICILYVDKDREEWLSEPNHQTRKYVETHDADQRRDCKKSLITFNVHQGFKLTYVFSRGPGDVRLAISHVGSNWSSMAIRSEREGPQTWTKKLSDKLVTQILE
jgi:hypothetical protein